MSSWSTNKLQRINLSLPYDSTGVFLGGGTPANAPAIITLFPGGVLMKFTADARANADTINRDFSLTGLPNNVRPQLTNGARTVCAVFARGQNRVVHVQIMPSGRMNFLDDINGAIGQNYGILEGSTLYCQRE
jgi:hypothetical protein